VSVVWRVEHEVDECSLEPGAHAFVKSESAPVSWQPVKIDDIEVFRQVPVRLGFEGELPRFGPFRRPPLHFHIRGLVPASGTDAVGRFGMFSRMSAGPLPPRARLSIAAIGPRRRAFKDLVPGLLARLLQPADLLGNLVRFLRRSSTSCCALPAFHPAQESLRSSSDPRLRIPARTSSECSLTNRKSSIKSNTPPVICHSFS